MNELPRFSKLRDAIARFRTQLKAPVTPDDRDSVHQWSEQVRQAFDEVEAILEEQRLRVHEKLFREMADQDPSQDAQISQLKKFDSEVQQMLEVVKSHIIVLNMQASTEVAARVENTVTDELEVMAVKDRGTELIDWIRDQEALVTAWFAEAFVNSVES